jgi:hypothetical protein
MFLCLQTSNAGEVSDHLKNILLMLGMYYTLKMLQQCPIKNKETGINFKLLLNFTFLFDT